MQEQDLDAELAAAADALRSAGASFAFVHGSVADGTARDDSDLDIAAWWEHDPPAAFAVDLPPGVDLVVLNVAPLELAGRIAVSGRLLFDTAPEHRVRWQATTRKIYFDELPRLTRAHREFSESVRRGR